MNTFEKPKFRDLSRVWKIIIVLVSVAFLGFTTSIIGHYFSENIFDTTTNLKLLLNYLDGNAELTSQNINNIKEASVFLLIVFVISLVDTLVSIFILIKASTNQNYPEGQDKTVWLTGLWAAFLFVQAPTGIPSLIVYWFYIIKRAKDIPLIKKEGVFE